MSEGVAAALAALAESEARLGATFDRLDDTLAGGPSLLPGWTRGVLVRHIAVNAWSNAAMVDAALRGEHRPQYPGGEAERTELIEQGRGRPIAELVADARSAAAEFRAVMERVGDRWDAVVPAGVGPVTIADRLHGRRFEVEVHHADLDAGYRHSDWPRDFVGESFTRVLDRIATSETLPDPGRWRIDAAGIGAWDLVVAAPVVAIGPADPAAAPRGTVGGDAAAVLAWLLGRGDAGSLGLAVTGDAAVAALPQRVPYG